MRPGNPTAQDKELGMVGGNKFGRYNKISDESTYNMIKSDNWLVNYAGYQLVKSIVPNGKGRGIFSSSKNNILIVVIDNHVYSISPNLNVTFAGNLKSFVGDVYIEENNTNQILISDFSKLYIYNAITTEFSVSTTTPAQPFTVDFIPGYITFQNGRFISPDTQNNQWRLSDAGLGKSWPNDDQHVGSLQTKPDNVLACLRVPGKGNLLFVFGSTVTEIWNDMGAALFPYQRNTSVNIDYGCLSVATISASDDMVVWLAYNEQSGPVIMVSTGADFERLSTDGIDYKLANLVNPKKSHAFLFKQDGHIFYQITFSDPADNFTLIYDFNTRLFFYATDENMNYHIAQHVAYFNNTYYFTSLNDGNLYEMNSKYTTYNYNDISTSTTYDPQKDFEIPRCRVCPPIRLKDSTYFISNSITFPIEQGNDPNFPGSLLEWIAAEDGTSITSEGESQDYYISIGSERVVDPYVPRVDLSISRDGSESFSNYTQKELNPLGKRKNRVVFWGQGAANDMVPQFRFWSKFRVVVGEGQASIYQ